MKIVLGNNRNDISLTFRKIGNLKFFKVIDDTFKDNASLYQQQSAY